MKRDLVLIVLLLACWSSMVVAKSKPKQDSLTTYIARVTQISAVTAHQSAGSLWVTGSAMSNLAADYKARNVGDVLIVNIVEQTLAEATGTVASQRSFAANSAITGMAGRINTRGLDPMFSGSSDSKLQGQAQTSSNSRLRTSVAGQVVAVLPNGNLIVQAHREVLMNNEKQTVMLRGVARQGDIGPDNGVLSTQLSDLEIELKGKGVISEATRKPNIVLRTLLRLLTF
jgi:flagellar L-ring protein FlgH